MERPGREPLKNLKEKPKNHAKELKELADTLKLCIKLGIKEIRIGDTHVIFGDSSQAPKKPRKAVVVAQDKAAQQTALQDEADRIREEIQVSHVEDPVAYEDAICEGLLTDDSGSTEKEEVSANNH